MLVEDLKPDGRREMDEMLAEAYLVELPEGLVRERERARRMARDMGVNQQGALEAMGMNRA